VNLSDGLDGLAAGISAIVCAVIALFAFQSGNIIMLVLMAGHADFATTHKFYFAIADDLLDRARKVTSGRKLAQMRV